MRRLETLRAPLAESEEPARQRWLAFEPDERLGPDQFAGGTEQRMAALDSAKEDAVELPDRSLDEARIDELQARRVGADARLTRE